MGVGLLAGRGSGSGSSRGCNCTTVVSVGSGGRGHAASTRRTWPKFSAPYAGREMLPRRSVGWAAAELVPHGVNNWSQCSSASAGDIWSAASASTPLPRQRLQCKRCLSAPAADLDDGPTSAMRFLKEIGYEDDVSDGIVRALKGSGIPDSSLAVMVRSMAGRWEVGHDAGLQDLARAVEVELAQTRGKVVVKFHVVVPHSGGRVFECEGLEGMSLRDVREHGGMKGGAELSEYIECACSGVMACSTCHVVVASEWYGKFDPPQTPEKVPQLPNDLQSPPPSLPSAVDRTHQILTEAGCAGHDRPCLRPKRDVEAGLPADPLQRERRFLRDGAAEGK